VPTFRDQSGDPADQLAALIQSLSDRIRTLEERGFRAPVMESDPPADDPTNAWMLADGRLCWRTLDGVTHRVYPEGQRVYPILHRSADPAASTGIDYYRNSGSDELRVRRPDGTWASYASAVAASGGEGGGNTGGGSTSTKPKPSDPTPKKYVRTYPATWARTFCATHGVETGGQLYYGTYPGSSHGMRRIMLGFNDSTIRSDLSGSTIRSVELTMLNTHSWPDSGVNVHFGAHNRSTAPAGFAAVRRNVWKGHWPKVGKSQEWRRTADWFGWNLRDGNIRGLTIDQPSASQAYYGQIEWSSVRLRIAYTK
jgi:hypothetical protein